MLYLKIINNNFHFFDNNFGQQLIGRIRIAGKSFLNWNPSGGLQTERICYDEAQKPHGWDTAYDLDIEYQRKCYRLTIHEGAIQKAFKPYQHALSAKGLKIENVLTTISAQPGPNGRCMLKFELAAEQGRIFQMQKTD